MAHTVATIDISSMTPPISRIARWSPFTIPLSTMSDISRGSSSVPIDWASASTSTMATYPRYGVMRRNSFSMAGCAL
jgi:hypothetical protein